MFRRRSARADGADPNASGADVYQGLRDQILGLDPAAAGLQASGPEDQVWACVMETGFPNGTATLVCLRDGTTSLYTSSGFGIIGGGAHPRVVQANGALLAAVSAELDRLPASHDQSLPSVGRTVIRALTYDGPRAYEAAEVQLGSGRDPLSPVFHAAHAVITELRLIHDEHS